MLGNPNRIARAEYPRSSRRGKRTGCREQEQARRTTPNILSEDASRQILLFTRVLDNAQ